MNHLRADFPFLTRHEKERSLVYFDNAATTQKPQQVIQTISDFYTYQNANVHRNVYRLAEEATQRYENVRAHVATLIGAQEPAEIIFTKGTTEGINLVAASWAEQHLKAGDEIVISALEHHANILPWQRVAERTGARIVVLPINPDGTLDMQAAQRMITEKTKLLAIIHVSNVLGTHVDLKPLITQAHAVGARVLVDAAQSVPHQKISVTDMKADFLAFSAHKILGPTGLGVLYIKKELHDQMIPYQLGGGMVYEADYHHATWLPAPRKFEAGTPPIAQVIGLGMALEYLEENVDFNRLQKYEADLCARVIDGLAAHKRITILGPVDQLKKQGHLVSFIVDGIHAHDVAAYLDAQGICVRAGHQCAQPLAKKLGLDAAVRVSFYFYNTVEEVDYFLSVMKKLLE